LFAPIRPSLCLTGIKNNTGLKTVNAVIIYKNVWQHAGHHTTLDDTIRNYSDKTLRHTSQGHL